MEVDVHNGHEVFLVFRTPKKSLADFVAVKNVCEAIDRRVKYKLPVLILSPSTPPRGHHEA